MKAVEFYRKAAAHNHAGALYKMGELTERGLGGLTQDPAKARDYYERAARQGSEEAKKALDRLGGKPASEPEPQEDPKEEPKDKEKGGGFFKKFFK